ncbi:MAG: hypothetical protein ABH873_07910 [Candidatus Firestonebacteria bacterium]
MTEYFSKKKNIVLLLVFLLILFFCGLYLFVKPGVFNFKFILYSFGFYALFTYLGLGLSIIFSPKILKKYLLFLSPVIGYCFLTLAGWFLYNTKFNGTNEYYMYILLLSLLFLVIAIFVKVNKKNESIEEYYNKELLIPSFIAILVFFILSFPSVKECYLTSISYGNCDIVNYARFSRGMQELNISAINSTNYFADLWLPQKTIFGSYLNTAFFSSVFKLEPFQVQNISVNMFFIFSVFLLYVVLRKNFKYDAFPSSVITLLYGLSSIMYCVVYNGFEAQIIATSLMLFFVLINTITIRLKKFYEMLFFLPFLVMVNWGFSLTYPHMFFITGCLIVFYSIVFSLYERSFKTFLRWFSFYLVSIVIVFLLSPFRFITVLEYTLFTKNVLCGWFISWISIDTALGFVPGKFRLSSPLVIMVVLTGILLIPVIHGLVNIFKKNKEIFIISIFFIVIIIFGTLVLATKSDPVEHGFGGYKQFKFITFFLPLLLASLLIIFKDKYNKIAFYTMVGLIFINSLCVSSNSIYMFKHHLVVSEDMADLQKLEKDKNVNSVNIPGGNVWWDIMWEGYFLMNKKVYFAQSTYYPEAPILKGEWNLNRGSPVRVTDKNDTILPVNSTYYLTKKSDIIR